MTAPSRPPSLGARSPLRAIARTILVLWVGIWLFFAVASRLGEGMSEAGSHTLAIRGGALLIVAATAWFAPRIGGWLLLLGGVLLGAGLLPFTHHAYWTVRLILGGPPVLVGLLLIVAFRGPLSQEPAGRSGQGSIE